MFQFIMARLAEPSTYAGFAGLFATVNVAVASHDPASIMSVVVQGAAVAASLAAVFKADKPVVPS